MLTNNLYQANGTSTPVKWYNEANGMIQTFAIPSLETYSNYGFRFPYQGTQQMGFSTVNKGIEFSSLSWYTAYYMLTSYDTYYTMKNEDGDVT